MQSVSLTVLGSINYLLTMTLAVMINAANERLILRVSHSHSDPLLPTVIAVITNPFLPQHLYHLYHSICCETHIRYLLIKSDRVMDELMRQSIVSGRFFRAFVPPTLSKLGHIHQRAVFINGPCSSKGTFINFAQIFIQRRMSSRKHR